MTYSGSLDEYSCDFIPTVTSGQTFQWTDKTTNSFPTTHSTTVYTTLSAYDSPTGSAEYIELDTEEQIWTSTFDAEVYIQHRFRLDDDVERIQDMVCERDEKFHKIQKSTSDCIHLVSDPVFPTLISFICSSQMSIDRIHQMQQNLAEEFGCSLSITDREIPVYPTPTELSQASESDLTELNLGYRSRYVSETASSIAEDTQTFESLFDQTDIEDSRKTLMNYLGVGRKVADCVLLYGLNYTSVVPIDTWMQSLGKQMYGWEDCTDIQLQKKFHNVWKEFAGYAQLYGFVYAYNHL